MWQPNGYCMYLAVAKIIAKVILVFINEHLGILIGRVQADFLSEAKYEGRRTICSSRKSYFYRTRLTID